MCIKTYKMIFEKASIKEVKIEIGLLCKQMRQTHRLTQQELGDALGLSRFTIQNFESGQNATLDTVLKIIRHFELLDKLHLAVKNLKSDHEIASMY